MRTFVLGAGASRHAGYPLTRELGKVLLDWTQASPDTYEERSIALEVLEKAEREGTLGDVESLLEEVSLSKPRFGSALLAGIERLFHAIRAKEDVGVYEPFATRGPLPGDVVITFNYDDAVERALRRAGKWQVGDGYGFETSPDEELKAGVRVLKLHGSVNWWAAAFGGRTSGFFTYSGSVLGARPVIPDVHFRALGYENLRDPKCPERTARLLAMIAPYRKKEFFFKTSSGPEFGDFYDDLWRQAEAALAASEEIFVLGYSLPQADERAADLLLGGASRGASVTIGCGASSDGIAQRVRAAGISRVTTTSCRFEELSWDGSSGRSGPPTS